MSDLGREALDGMNRLILNQQRLKMKLERMGDNQIADLIKKVERLQEQKQKVIALIKDGRFVEALKELEDDKEI